MGGRRISVRRAREAMDVRRLRARTAAGDVGINPGLGELDPKQLRIA